MSKRHLPRQHIFDSLTVLSTDFTPNLFVDASDGVVPSKNLDLKSVKKNTLFLPNNTTRKNMKNAYLVLTKYKTVLLYGRSSNVSIYCQGLRSRSRNLGHLRDGLTLVLYDNLFSAVVGL